MPIIMLKIVFDAFDCSPGGAGKPAVLVKIHLQICENNRTPLREHRPQHWKLGCSHEMCRSTSIWIFFLRLDFLLPIAQGLLTVLSYHRLSHKRAHSCCKVTFCRTVVIMSLRSAQEYQHVL